MDKTPTHPSRVVLARIMTYNLRRDIPDDVPHTWAARRPLVSRTLRECAPDILGTQEGLPHQLVDIDAALPTHARISTPRAAGDEACAIHYSRARYATLGHGTFWLSDTPERAGSATWGNRHPRIVTWAHLRERASEETLLVANTHFDHESDLARRRSAALVAKRLPGAILLGDLNADPTDPALQDLFEAGWTDGGARDPTFHAFTGHATTRIDHVLVPHAFQVRSHEVIAPIHDGIHASDHHAVLASVERKRR